MNKRPERANPDLDQIKELVKRLADTEAAIQSLIAGQADAIIDPHSGALILLQQAQQALQQSEARYHRLLTHLSAIVFELSPEGTVLFVNDNVEKVTGYAPRELLGKNWWDIFLPGERRPRADELRRMLQEKDIDHYECDWIKKDGRPITVELSSANRYDKTGALASIVGFATDITARRQAEDRLRQAAVVYEATPNAIIIADGERRIRAVNKAYTQITGYPASEVVGRNPRLQKSGRHDRKFYQDLWRSVEVNGHWQGEIWNRRKNGEIYPAWENISAVRDDRSRIIGYVSVFTDITSIKESEAKLDYLAHHDALTGVANRLLLNVHLEALIPRARRRRSQGFALLFLDLDRFKSVNDVYGHEYGDRLLQMVTTRVRSCVRAEDMLARVGGDEFVLVLEDISEPTDVARMAEKIIEVTAQPFNIEGREILTSMSIGISMYPDDGETGEDLVRAADTAMYSAKLRGRNRYQFSTLELTQRTRAYFSLQGSLRQALVGNQFVVHYQPEVALESGEIVGVEALIRWQHPELGLVMPERFIPIAEEIGLIDAIGEWVLRTACAEVASWGAVPLRIAVNLSRRQIVHNHIFEQVRSILRETGLKPSALELEITESVLQDSREGVEALEGLSALGVRVAIDDFGTGYSSLAQLKQLPIDTLKIDQSFIREIPHDPDGEAITATIIGMAHTLKLKVVAEGVERPEQLQFLRARGCDEWQGLLFSPPIPAAAFRQLLASRKHRVGA